MTQKRLFVFVELGDERRSISSGTSILLLREGNVFTPVILFTGGGEVSVPACTTGHMTRGLGGGSLCGGGGLSTGAGVCWRGPPYGNEQAVRILQECILFF